MLLKWLYLCLILMISAPHISGCKARCLQPMKTGPGNANIKRYYYNKATGKCQKFTYGGRSGNGNNFQTLKACQRNCM